MIKDFNFNLFDVLNKVKTDKFGHVSAFLALNKPVGITSHDLVNQIRTKLETRRVGHAGALDPFASGVMLVLVGKDYTKLAEDLINLNKSYRTKIVFGVSTDTLDTEGKISVLSDTKKFDFKVAKQIFLTFDGGYKQFVPIYSSVKVAGHKLRQLARKSQRYEFFAQNGKKCVRFEFENGAKVEVELPYRKVLMSNLKYLSEGFIERKELNWLNSEDIGKLPEKLPFIEVEFECSKGTYVRQFAYDLAQEFDHVGMLISLERTKIADIALDKCISVDDVHL